jgi:hypothetical protein
MSLSKVLLAKPIVKMCIALVFVFLLTACDEAHEKYVDGKAQAKSDLAKGEFNIAIAGGSDIPAFGEYIELLHSRYGIGRSVYSFPHNFHAAEAWARGYNEIARPEVERKIGAKILEQTMSEAQKIHENELHKPKNENGAP